LGPETASKYITPSSKIQDQIDGDGIEVLGAIFIQSGEVVSNAFPNTRYNTTESIPFETAIFSASG
jgi:hypothetical protein